MPNPKYNKGANKERHLVNEAREKGFLSFRSAGSHSPIDVVIIDKMNREIMFIQSKSDNMSEKAKMRLELEQINLNGSFKCTFKVL